MTELDSMQCINEHAQANNNCPGDKRSQPGHTIPVFPLTPVINNNRSLEINRHLTWLTYTALLAKLTNTHNNMNIR